MKKKVYYIDIDGIIFENQDRLDYKSVKPIYKNIDKISRLYDDGNIIILWTSRGSCTGINFEDETKRQLKKYKVKYHLLRTDKPYYDVFIDDRARDKL